MKELTEENLRELFRSQLEEWPQAKNNYSALKDVKSKRLDVEEFPVEVQFNPARIVSSAAKVDPKSIQERKCFLCEENRPSVQRGLSYQGPSGYNYSVLINPFPIFPYHLTIPDVNHVDQLIKGRVIDMLDLAEKLSDYVLFYNGPLCGASAPDHFHFQAGNKGFLPVEKDFDFVKKALILRKDKTYIFTQLSFVKSSFILLSSSREEMLKHFDDLYNSLELKDGELEPMLNLVSWKTDDKWYLYVVLRSKHRPDRFYAEGDDNMLISPASVDFGGVFITPVEKNFRSISAKDISDIIAEVTYDQKSMNKVIEKVEQINEVYE